MTIKLSTKLLQEAVSVVSRAVSANAAIPALKGILIKTKKNSIILVGYDLEMGITTEVSASVVEEGQAVVDARLFSEIVRRLPEEIVTIETTEQNMILIASGKSDFSLVGVDAADYPEIPTLIEEERLIVNSHLLKQMIRQTIFAVSVTDIKPVLKGVLFELSNNRIKLVALDGYRLALRSEPIENVRDYKFIVPGKTLQEISKLLSEEDVEVNILIGKRHVLFCVGNYNVFSRLIDGEFINYEMAIPKKSSKVVYVETLQMIQMIERVSLLINDRIANPIHCIFEDKTIESFCETTIGKAKDQISARIQGERLEIAFNNLYMLNALKACEETDVRIELENAQSPIVIKPQEGEEFLFLILPVKLRNEH